MPLVKRANCEFFIVLLKTRPGQESHIEKILAIYLFKRLDMLQHASRVTFVWSIVFLSVLFW